MRPTVKALLPGLVHTLAAHALDEVQDRAIRQAEAAFDRFGSVRQDAAQRCLEQVLLREHQVDQAFAVVALAACTTGHLHEVARRHIVKAHTIKLAQACKHHRTRGCVDAQGKGLGREQQTDHTGCEEPLDHFLVDRQHAGVVPRDAFARRTHDLLIQEAVFQAVRFDQLFLQLQNVPAFLARHELHARHAACQTLAVLA